MTTKLHPHLSIPCNGRRPFAVATAVLVSLLLLLGRPAPGRAQGIPAPRAARPELADCAAASDPCTFVGPLRLKQQGDSSTFELAGRYEGQMLWLTAGNRTRAEMVLSPRTTTPSRDMAVSIKYVPGPAGQRQGRLDIGQLDSEGGGAFTHGLTVLRTAGQERLTIDASGNVGVGTSQPASRLHVGGGGLRVTAPMVCEPICVGGESTDLRGDGTLQVSAGSLKLNPGAGNVGVGTTSPAGRLHVRGAGSFASAQLQVEQAGGDGYARLRFQTATGRAWDIAESPDDQLRFFTPDAGDVVTLSANGNVGIGTTSPQVALDVRGTTRTAVLEITGGADLAEPFPVADGVLARQGMVLAIDPHQPGALRLADRAYDRRVAGVVSGANGVRPGMTMSQAGSPADGDVPVALTGRVYVWVDASYGAVEPGDLLTSSDTPGHAMKVTDYERAHGAVIGKAMSGLATGRGLVLVLVGLQ